MYVPCTEVKATYGGLLLHEGHGKWVVDEHLHDLRKMDTYTDRHTWLIARTVKFAVRNFYNFPTVLKQIKVILKPLCMLY